LLKIRRRIVGLTQRAFQTFFVLITGEPYEQRDLSGGSGGRGVGDRVVRDVM
jgi:hypothetical protein